MRECRWISERIALAIHAGILSDDGGAEGILNQGLLESTLARPKNLHAYEAAGLHRLAASLGYGFAKNHCFVDGNKRTALMAVYTFLWINGARLTAPDADATIIVLGVAEGEISEDQFAEWIQANMIHAVRNT